MDENWCNAEEETIDDLIIGNLKIIQPRKGYRFAIDAILLAHYPGLSYVKTVLELGTGSGVIALILAHRTKHAHITGIEIQEAVVQRARRNIKMNGLQERIDIVAGDIRQIQSIFPAASFDLVLSNPPFWKNGQGRVNKNYEVAISRHELAVNLEEIIKAAKYVLSAEGSFCLIQRAERIEEIINCCARYGLGKMQVKMIHSYADEKPGLVIVEAQPSRSATVYRLEPLVIYEQPGIYSQEILRLYQEV